MMNLQGVGNEAIHPAFKLLGYACRKLARKGFLDDPAVTQQRAAFAEEGLT